MKKEKRPRRNFTEEQKLEIVRAFYARGDEQLKDFAKRVDVGDGNIRDWVKKYGDSVKSGAAPPTPPRTEPDAAFLDGGLAERMKTLVGVSTESLPAEAPRERKKPGPKPRSSTQALLPWEPRPVVTVPAEEPAESEQRMVDYLKKSAAGALKERDALALVLGMVLRDPDAFGGGIRR